MSIFHFGQLEIRMNIGTPMAIQQMLRRLTKDFKDVKYAAIPVKFSSSSGLYKKASKFVASLMPAYRIAENSPPHNPEVACIPIKTIKQEYGIKVTTPHPSWIPQRKYAQEADIVFFFQRRFTWHGRPSFIVEPNMLCQIANALRISIMPILQSCNDTSDPSHPRLPP